MPLREDQVRLVFERITKTGELDVIAALVRDAAALVEHELLQKLGTFPIANSEDVCAFVYRQGWLQALRQMATLFDPTRVRDAAPPVTAERLAFREEDL
jgi:hypothetical protein